MPKNANVICESSLMGVVDTLGLAVMWHICYDIVCSTTQSYQKTVRLPDDFWYLAKSQVAHNNLFSALLNIWIKIVLFNRCKFEKTSTPLWKDIEQDKKSLPLCRGKKWKHVLSGANRIKCLDDMKKLTKFPSAKWLFWYNSKF